MASDFLPTATDIDYTPAGVSSTPTERCNVFVPDEAETFGERSCHVQILNSGFTTGTPLTSLPDSQTLPYRRMQRGSVFVSASLCQVEPVGSGGPAGSGTWDSHLSTAPDTDHWNDPAFPNAVKSIGHLVGWLKTVGVSTYGIDPNKITLEGRSGASSPVLWSGLAADFNSFTDSGQFISGVSTRVAGIVPIQLNSWWPAYENSGADIVSAPWAPKSSDPLGASALSWSDTFTDYPKWFSAMHFGFDNATYANIQARNAQMPVFIHAGRVFAGIENQFDAESAFLLDSDGLPILTDTLIDEHDGWHAIMLRRRLLSIAPEFHSKSSRITMEASKRFHKKNGVYLSEGETLVGSFADGMEVAADWVDAVHGLRPFDEPIPEKIIGNVQAALTEMVQGVEYFTTPVRIDRGIDGILNHSGEAPLISIVSQTSEWMPEGEEVVDGLSSRLRLEIIFLQRGRDGDRPEQAVHRTCRDIIKALQLDPQRSQLATSTTIVGIEYLHSDQTMKGLQGASMEVEFEFRTPFHDQNQSI